MSTRHLHRSSVCITPVMSNMHTLYLVPRVYACHRSCRIYTPTPRSRDSATQQRYEYLYMYKTNESWVFPVRSKGDVTGVSNRPPRCLPGIHVPRRHGVPVCIEILPSYHLPAIIMKNLPSNEFIHVYGSIAYVILHDPGAIINKQISMRITHQAMRRSGYMIDLDCACSTFVASW
jgi:hypothetical protein